MSSSPHCMSSWPPHLPTSSSHFVAAMSPSPPFVSPLLSLPQNEHAALRTPPLQARSSRQMSARTAPASHNPQRRQFFCGPDIHLVEYLLIPQGCDVLVILADGAVRGRDQGLGTHNVAGNISTSGRFGGQIRIQRVDCVGGTLLSRLSGCSGPAREATRSLTPHHSRFRRPVLTFLFAFIVRDSHFFPRLNQ